MISYKMINKELAVCKKLMKQKLQEDWLQEGVLEAAITIREEIHVLEWILEANDND